jgi:CheY-like chemotaxis protein
MNRVFQNERAGRQRQAAPTVLVVEDERIARQALAHLLVRSGFAAAACESAEEALEALGRLPAPAVALVDVDLPGMDGLDFVARLEQLRPGLVTVLITAAAGERIARFREQHDVHYIRKPLDFARLLQILASSGSGAGRIAESAPVAGRKLS